MTDHGAPGVGDLVYDPVTRRRATVSDIRGGAAYVLRVAGAHEWTAQEPDRLETITRRADRTDWMYPQHNRP